MHFQVAQEQQGKLHANTILAISNPTLQDGEITARDQRATVSSNPTAQGDAKIFERNDRLTVK